ncbi:MAG TPA: hypothetical protein VKG24_15715 [Pseudolabrys sp.]|nr:hypothetical protein [Pseudolabrys sp.]
MKKIEGRPVVLIEVDESEEITVAVRAEDLLEGDTTDPWRHPIAIALRRQDDVDDARVTKNETLVRRGKKWFRYDAPDKRLFKPIAEDAGAMTDTPSLVPVSESSDVYVVLDALPTFGRVWRELSEEAANQETVLKLIENGEFHGPVRVIVFNTAEGWSRDVSEAIAGALLGREVSEGDLSESARRFVEQVLDTAT